MRMDYSEPKKSYKTSQGGNSRPRSESSGSLFAVVVITCLVSLGVGFGSGWMLSGRYAKKGFKAAMEQQSLENSPRQSAEPQALPAKPQTIAAQTPDASQQPAPGGTQQPSAAHGSLTTPDPPLSFYKNLPSGQKNNVMGSGINTKIDKPVKQPLQAAIPTNLAKPPQPQNPTENNRPPAPPTADKTGGRHVTNVFVVQIAALSLKSEADILKNKLANKGYNAYIVESNQGDKGIWYRVRVGRGMDQEAAKELAGKLGKGAKAIPEKE